MSPTKVVSIVGARPQFVKLAPVARAFSQIRECRHTVIHTGQHYDEKMSEDFFQLLDIPAPEINLAIGSATHGAQTAAMLVAIEDVLLDQKPSGVLVYGDTNSTLAAVLASAKLGIPVAHIEAGLRSFNRRMPEEINRVTADHCSDRLYAPTPVAMQNLKNENLDARAFLGGDVMRDAVKQFYEIASRRSELLERLNIKVDEYVLLTLHRPVNTSKKNIEHLLSVINEFASAGIQILFPVHPRTRSAIQNTEDKYGSIRFHEPLNYLDMLACVASARVVITDSGGLQKEAAFLNTPCITIRSETEWTELVELGVNRLVDTDSRCIKEAMAKVYSEPDPFNESVLREIDRQYGTGDAAQSIVNDFFPWLIEKGV